MPDGPPAAWLVVLLGLWVFVSPFVFLDSPTGTYGIVLVVSGLVFIVIPAVMIGQMVNEQQATPPDRSTPNGRRRPIGALVGESETLVSVSELVGQAAHDGARISHRIVSRFG